MKRANHARAFHDLTCAVLILAYNTAAVGIYFSICGEAVAPNRAIVSGVVVVAVSCFATHLWLSTVYYRPAPEAA